MDAIAVENSLLIQNPQPFRCVIVEARDDVIKREFSPDRTDRMGRRRVTVVQISHPFLVEGQTHLPPWINIKDQTLHSLGEWPRSGNSLGKAFSFANTLPWDSLATSQPHTASIKLGNRIVLDEEVSSIGPHRSEDRSAKPNNISSEFIRIAFERVVPKHSQPGEADTNEAYR